MEMIEEKTGTGKGPPQNGLELKVYRLVGFLQSQLNQEVLCRLIRLADKTDLSSTKGN